MAVPRQREVEELDVVIIGAGFAAFDLIQKLRKQGLSVKIFEKGADSGGVWYWNAYPGARCDSPGPIYQLFHRELYETFTFKQKYADREDIKRYFEHVEKTWDLRKDIVYNRNVEAATFDDNRQQWLVKCSNGAKVWCRWLVAAMGFAAKKFIPDIKGLGSFKGEVVHTAAWPQWGLNLEGKRVAVIGTGASGIQVIQEAGSSAKYLTVYQRTPNLCLPMQQRTLDPTEENKKKAENAYEKLLQRCPHTFGGYFAEFNPKNTFDESPEEREKFYQSLFDEGGLAYWLLNYKDLLTDKAANDAAYQFWRTTVLRRITDPAKAELLAPAVPPHPFGTKRPSLEQNFYEVMNLPHINIVDLGKDTIEEVTTTGIRTVNGKFEEYDVIVLATGFDAVSGSLTQPEVIGSKGQSLKQYWADGLRTALGIAANGFPNLFFTYGPQAPTAFSNGPSLVQVQAQWIDKALKLLLAQKITRIEARRDAEEEWIELVRTAWAQTLFPQANSWYQGANIPGRKVEPLCYVGGLPAYTDALEKSLENNLQGWICGSSQQKLK